MEEEIQIWIERAEDSWLDELYKHAESQFRLCSLPSHDHRHHLRVWKLCKSLLTEISTFNSRMDQSLVEGVLIAALFHDLGMATSSREDHGRLSRESCEQWFLKSGREFPERYEEILEAIELHDRKDEEIYRSFHAEQVPQILGILSAADDLEALGTIGIYRYAEIYLLRGIPLEELGTRILDNAKTRFEKLEKACRLCPRLLTSYRKEYDELRQFFEQYNQELKDTTQAEHSNSGALGVINYIRMHGLDNKESDQNRSDVREYFRKLEYELEQARS